MTPRTAFDLWERSVRRALRDYIRDAGQVPSLCAFASKGANVRKVEMLPRLDLMLATVSVKDQIDAHVRRHGSLFAAYGGLSIGARGDDPMDKWFGLVVFSEVDVRKVGARVTLTGLGGWAAQEFRLGDDHEFVVRALREVNAPRG